MSQAGNALKYFLKLEHRAKYKLIKRYDKPLSYHDVKMINDILYNEKTHYVEAFKEYLIYEDYNEFLKRFYKNSELKIKLPKILMFYEKYSKIYANYTVIPESKYMYKNIKRKQKMIDQMQNNDVNNSENEEEEEENEEISNTVFSSRVMNSICRKTLSTLNKSDNEGKSEQSINNFISQISEIETKANQINQIDKNKNTKKFQKNIILPVKMNKIFMNNNGYTKQNQKNRIQINKNEKFLSNNRTNNNNNNSKNKNLEIQFTYSKKSFQNEVSNVNNKTINNNDNNTNYYIADTNAVNTKANSNLIIINDYMSKNNYKNYSNSNSILNNNNSIGNYTNNSNTFHSHKNSLKLKNISKQKIKQNIINHSNNLYNMKENMSESNINNINNYFSNGTNIDNNLKNNNNHKYKLSLGETLLKQDKIVLSTNTSVSPNAMRENIFSSPANKNNILVNKKRLFLKEKLIEKGYLNPESNSNIMKNNDKKIKSDLLMEYNSSKPNQKLIENKTQKNINKKKFTKKIKEIQNIKDKESDNYAYSEIQSNINANIKKPESHRNYYHNKILSNNIKNKIMSNTNKGFKITVGIKPEFLSKNHKASVTTHCSPNSSSSNFYYNSQYNKIAKKNQEKNIKNALDEINKKKVVNYNIINNIQDNSTQINIYTGSELYKSLHLHNNSVFNSPYLTPGGGTFSRSPIGRGIGDKIKPKANAQQMNYFKSQIKGREKNKYNLNLKKIINKRILESDREKCIISERLMTHNKLLEKLEKYFMRNKENNINNTNIKINNYNSNNNNNINNHININNKNNNKNNYNRNNILYNNYTKNTNGDHHKLITKIISNNFNNSKDKQLKNKDSNNNTPLKRNYNKYLKENQQNKYLSPQNNEQFRKIAKPIKKQKINYNSLMGNLTDLNKIGFDENKFLINSERNKNYKIIFK